MKKIIHLFAVALFLVANPLFAQDKPLSVSDYERWSRIVGTSISDDGNWMAYGLRPNGGDDTLYIQSLSGGDTYNIPFGDNARFSDDSRWVSYMVGQDEETREKLSEANKPVFERAELLNLSTGEKAAVERAGQAAFSGDGRYWAVHREKPEGDNTRHGGRDLVVRNLQEGTMINLGNVSQFSFNRRGDRLAWLVDADGRTGNGVYLMNLETQAVTVLDSDTTFYTGLSWDDEEVPEEEVGDRGRRLAVLKGVEADSLEHRVNRLLVIDGIDGQPRKSLLDPAEPDDFPGGMVISENRTPAWSRDGEIVLFGIRLQEPNVEMSRDTIPNVDVFHWNDDRIQTVQMRRANSDRRFTWLASFDPATSAYVRLTDEEMREIQQSPHSGFMVGRDEERYRSDINWGVSPADLYRVNVRTGERTRFAEQVNRPMGYSPDGRYYLFQQDTTLFVHDLEQNRTVDISSSAAPVRFMNMEHPYPHENPAYGVAGWTEDGEHVIVNHKFDLWMLALDGSDAVNVTGGVGEEEQIVFRYETLDPEEEYIDTDEELLLSAYGEWTKKSGYYAVEIGNEPRPLLFADARFGNPMKAEDADRVLLTQETFVDFPDYHLTDSRFRNPEKVTDANPQQAEYAWGRRILVDFENGRGEKLQGTLTLPAGYEEGEAYPTLIYFYETMSERHHQYSMPTYDDRPHMSTYASNGYMVFMPDIKFEEGRPGTSSLDGITSAANRIIELGYADPDRIGLQGHSWGGYQTSFILTQTDMFRTIVTGAPPTNLESFYNNIYGSTGTNHHGIMEIGQVRMGRGVTPWTHREDYRRENPMAHIPDISTPFMILHGTEDGAVDWSQGLELYNAARRMGKEVVFLSYPEEGHHLRNEANQKDFLVRMQQWFDHYLKGAEAPAWMVEGIPHLEKLYEKADR